eukprot:maker-scaffold_13-snap-gene-8.7-mRNA-1 protein AED:0.00 eAED:0.00 QI:419/1/1/1/1/1/2/34/552
MPKRSKTQTKNLSELVHKLEQVRIQHASPPGSESYSAHVFFALPTSTLAKDFEYTPIVWQSINEVEQTSKGEVSQYHHVRDDRDSGAYANATNGVYTSPLLLHVLLENLPHCETVTYRVGLKSDSIELIKKTQTFSFRTPPARGESCLALEQHQKNVLPEMILTVCGDIGQTENSMKTLRFMKNRHFEQNGDLYQGIVIVGDMSYADGDQTRWDTWGHLFSPLFSKTPVIALTGNHEIELDKETGESFVSYRHRFFGTNPRKEETAPADNVSKESLDDYTVSLKYDYGASYYSMDLGKLHMIVLNTYNTNKEGEKNQKQWLIEDLKAVDREVTPFIVVASHAPMTSTSMDHQKEASTLNLAKWVKPLLNKYKVELAFSGHVHAYERFNKLNNTVFITIGDAGNHEGLYDQWVNDDLAEELSAARSGRYYGSGELEVYNDTHMRWIWLPNPSQFVGRGTKSIKSTTSWDDDIRLDQVWIESNYKPSRLNSIEEAMTARSSLPLWFLAFLVLAIGYILFPGNTKQRVPSDKNVYKPVDSVEKDTFGTFQKGNIA